jgi:hypothetical protein
MKVMGAFDEFVTLPDNKEFNVEESKERVKPTGDSAITNGDIIAEAIRTKDNVLKFEMERRFQAWCSETHHSVYSAGDKKFWKSQRFEK